MSKNYNVIDMRPVIHGMNAYQIMMACDVLSMQYHEMLYILLNAIKQRQKYDC